ncbi:MAG: phospholipid/cholesterol/gamma-HCH transport system ATP-binding protein [Candidatus Promineifilaceae bacterium]|jgi:phospholipid/cholesterol/gamma-HCH transport system ATP-binding protein
MIEFKNVVKSFGENRVLAGMDLNIAKGETFVVCGPSGVGKSVTLKHMVRLLTPDSGDILIGDESIVDAGSHDLERIRQRFGYLFQGGAMLAWMNVAENVALPLIEKTDMARSEIDDRVNITLKRVGLDHASDRMPSEISGGMKKRAGLARAIIREPEIILYDEPTSGLDPVSSRSIDALINQLREELGVTGVVVTHDLHSALAIGDRIGMLNGGRFIDISDPEAFIQSDNDFVQDFLAAQYITAKGPWERNES